MHRNEVPPPTKIIKNQIQLSIRSTNKNPIVKVNSSSEIIHQNGGDPLKSPIDSKEDLKDYADRS